MSDQNKRTYACAFEGGYESPDWQRHIKRQAAAHSAAYRLRKKVKAQASMAQPLDVSQTGGSENAARSQQENRWGSCCGPTIGAQEERSADLDAEARAAMRQSLAEEAALERQTAGPRAPRPVAAAVAAAEAAYAAMTERKRGSRLRAAHDRLWQTELRALGAADEAHPAPVPPPELPPYRVVEAPPAAAVAAHSVPYVEAGVNDIVTPSGGGPWILKVRQVTPEDAAALTSMCVDGIDGGRLPRCPPGDGEYGPMAIGGHRASRNDGTCDTYMQFHTPEGPLQHEFGKDLMLQYYMMLRKYFKDEQLAAHEVLPPTSLLCVSHRGTLIPYSHFALTRDHVSQPHMHHDEGNGWLFTGMSGTGAVPRRWAFVFSELGVWVRLRPGLVLHYNASRLTHATFYDFQPLPPPADDLASQQRVYGLAMVLKNTAMKYSQELMENAIKPIVRSQNKFRRAARGWPIL